MVTISFYSYKGGVGRSLALANLGVYLAQFGATVAMVDFDLEAPGLHYKLSPEGPIEISNRGVAGLLADVSRGRAISEIDWNLALDISEHAESPLPGADSSDDRGRLYLIPAGNPMLHEYWSDLALIDWDGLFVGGQRPGVFALSHFKRVIEEEIGPDFLLVDSRTGITPGGGVSTTLLPDVVVMMMLNTPEHVDGSRLVLDAVTSARRGGEVVSQVVPVLSRYTSPEAIAKDQPAERPAGRPRLRNEQLHMVDVPPGPPGVAPLSSLSDALVEGLTHDAVSRVHDPLVLHSDPQLQQREYLTFGRYAEIGLGASGRTLLEDYLRLFAALVPEETFIRFMPGVRERARSILLDNPEDAVRSLESVTTLTGDEGAFVDLVKVYLLRREVGKMITAAEALYRVHDRIVPEPTLTRELKNLVTGRARVTQRLAPDGPAVSSEFAEAYWRRAAPEEFDWGASIARLYADRGDLERGRVLAEEIISPHSDPKVLGIVVRILAFGGDGAETVAVQIAVEHFEAGKESGLFLSAAAAAARFQEDSLLAGLIVDSQGVAALDAEDQVRLLFLADRAREAAGLFVGAFSAADPDEVDIDGLSDLWKSLGRRVPEVRGELHERNPELAERLDLASADDNPF